MSHWGSFAKHNSVYSPPLRPSDEVISKMVRIIGDGRGPLLLLGVTPELALAFDNVVAVDKSSEMITTVWPGDSCRRKAVCGDWLALNLDTSSMRAVVGDGSLNNIPDFDAISLLLTRCLRWLVPGGHFACRVFERPERPFSQADILARARAAEDFNFHALKWMIAMHLASRDGAIVPVQSIRLLFNALFPNRDVLAQQTGWPAEAIATIDVYANSMLSYCFPSRQELLELVPSGVSITFNESGDYPLAHCCPILSFINESHSTESTTR